MSTFLEGENDPKSPKNIREIKVEALSSLDAESQSQQQPNSLYPSLKSEEPSRNNPSDEISPENLPEIAKDYSSVNGNEQGTVKDVLRAEDLEDAEPTEQILLLEQEDLEAPSPYREPVDEALPLPETAENKAALVPPVRKKRKKLPQKKDPEQIGQVPEEDNLSPDGSPSVQIANTNGRWWLYLAEIFGRWGDRMWSFTGALFLHELFPGSMLFPAIHGLVTGLCVILFASLIGEWVDRTPRLRAVRIALITQNSAVAVGSLVLTFAFLFFRENLPVNSDSSSNYDARKTGCVVVFLLFAIVADCASVAMNIIVEKDWVVVMAAGNRTDLADMNATIRRIDLTCQILSPIIIAQIMTFSEHYVGTIVVSAWNVMSMVAEYFILHSIYEKYPRLAIKQAKTSTTGENIQKRPLIRKVFRSCFAIVDGWQIYFKNRVAPAGIALACLYFTVLSFSGVTNTYIRTQGLSESVISIMMAVGAVTGIAGTFVFPRARGKIGLERTGLFALSAQLFFLVFCVMSVWLPGSPFDPTFVQQEKNQTLLEVALERDRNVTNIDSGKWITRPVAELPSVIVFMIGMIGARFGLWMIDLTITQLLQENVSERERGVVGGVQSALSRFMDMLKFILVIFLPHPETFGILIIISFLLVVVGDFFYGYYSYKVRGHVLPHCGPGPRIIANSDVLDNPSIVLQHRAGGVTPSSV